MMAMIKVEEIGVLEPMQHVLDYRSHQAKLSAQLRASKLRASQLRLARLRRAEVLPPRQAKRPPGPIVATAQTLRKRRGDQITRMKNTGFLSTHHTVAAEQYAIVVESWDKAVAASGGSLGGCGGSNACAQDMFSHMSRHAYGLWETHYRGWAWWLSINGVWLPVGTKSDGRLVRMKRRQFKCGADIMRAVVIDNAAMGEVEAAYSIPRKAGRILVREMLELWDRMGHVRLSNKARPIDAG